VAHTPMTHHKERKSSSSSWDPSTSKQRSGYGGEGGDVPWNFVVVCFGIGPNPTSEQAGEENCCRGERDFLRVGKDWTGGA